MVSQFSKTICQDLSLWNQTILILRSLDSAKTKSLLWQNLEHIKPVASATHESTFLVGKHFIELISSRPCKKRKEKGYYVSKENYCDDGALLVILIVFGKLLFLYIILHKLLYKFRN